MKTYVLNLVTKEKMNNVLLVIVILIIENIVVLAMLAIIEIFLIRQNVILVSKI